MRSFKRYVCVVRAVMGVIAVSGCESTLAEDAGMSEAAAAVRKAELAVQRAQAQRALWTSAEEALRKARRALGDGDAPGAIDQALIAQKQSELGIAQKSYPLFHER
ncbi:MAG: hypothetical protein ABI619_03165 [Betaproteobacteria bacterium]